MLGLAVTALYSTLQPQLPIPSLCLPHAPRPLCPCTGHSQVPHCLCSVSMHVAAPPAGGLSNLLASFLNYSQWEPSVATAEKGTEQGLSQLAQSGMRRPISRHTLNANEGLPLPRNGVLGLYQSPLCVFTLSGSRPRWARRRKYFLSCLHGNKCCRSTVHGGLLWQNVRYKLFETIPRPQECNS